MSKLIITPLGTVSPYEKDKMNCPGFLVEYNNKKILLDCGNGITSLLKFPDDLRDLYVIISHYHKDHFGDLGALQYASFVYHNLGLIDKKVKVFLPKNDYCYNKTAITLNSDSYTDYYDIDDSTSIHIDDLTISFYDNHSHSIESYMVKLESNDFKVVYTSDIGTTNFDRLIDFCYDSDLIICESSFLIKHNSNSKTHMRAYDAGLLASRSNSNKLLLTHFWPEEDKELYVLEAREVFENVEAAREGYQFVLNK